MCYGDLEHADMIQRTKCHLEFLKFELYAVIGWDIGITFLEKRMSIAYVGRKVI